MNDRLSVLLGLSVLLMIGWAVLITQATAERGREAVTVEMDTCINPGLIADGRLWETSDTMPTEDWIDETTLTAGFEWKGDRGTLRVPHGELTYVSGNFLSLVCVIG
jgi:hypothetical protein